MHSIKNHFKSGYTLIELTLSIAFIAVLSVTIALITSDMISSYKKGLVLKQVNTTGTDIIDDMRSAISDSSAKSYMTLCETTYDSTSTVEACQNDQAGSFISLTRYSYVQIIGAERINVPVFGAFCSGTYSYIWNSGYFFDSSLYHVEDTAMAKFVYRQDGGSTATLTKEGFRLLKINDPSRSVCVAATLNGGSSYNDNPTISNSFNITGTVNGNSFGAITEEPVDLILADGNSNLAIYDLSIAQPAQDETTRNVYYYGSFILATIDGGINVRSGGDYCATPDEYKGANFDYCAINKFNFAIRATGE